MADQTSTPSAATSPGMDSPSPLQSSPFDSTPLQLTVQKLNGRNYLEWAQSIRLMIEGRGRIGHLTGEIKKPADQDPKLAQWKSENSLVIAWLVNSMEPAIRKTCLFLPTAKDVWESVKETYCDVENSSQIFDLKTKLWQTKQGAREATDYFNEMLALWQELDLCYAEE